MLSIVMAFLQRPLSRAECFFVFLLARDVLCALCAICVMILCNIHVTRHSARSIKRCDLWPVLGKAVIHAICSLVRTIAAMGQLFYMTSTFAPLSCKCNREVLLLCLATQPISWMHSFVIYFYYFYSIYESSCPNLLNHFNSPIARCISLFILAFQCSNYSAKFSI